MDHPIIMHQEYHAQPEQPNEFEWSASPGKSPSALCIEDQRADGAGKNAAEERGSQEDPPVLAPGADDDRYADKPSWVDAHAADGPHYKDQQRYYHSHCEGA